MAWIYLLSAEILEIFWATTLKLSHGFTIIKYSLLTAAGCLLSFYLLAQATKVLPLGTAYAIWTGIGALGAVAIGIIFFKEPVTLQRLFFIILLLTGIIGLKVSSGH